MSMDEEGMVKWEMKCVFDLSVVVNEDLKYKKLFEARSFVIRRTRPLTYLRLAASLSSSFRLAGG